MERLRGRDFRAILQFLVLLYAPTTGLGDIGDCVTRNLPDLIPCEIASYNEMNLDRRSSNDRVSPPDCWVPEVAGAWLSVMHEHPVLTHIQQTRDLRAYRISDFYSETRYRGSALFNEFYKKIDVQDALCKGIRVSGRVVVGSGAYRNRRSFTQRERLIFDLLGPHLTQAWRNARAMTRIQDELKMLGCTLDQLDRAPIILDRLGRVRFLSERARRLLALCFGRPEEAHGRLPEELQRWLRNQLSRMDSVTSLQPRTPLVVEREGKRIEFRIMAEPDRTLVLIEEQRNSASPAELAPPGLTRRESEVLAWVAEGKTNGEIALILGASSRTIQKHLEHIFTKLGVETRTAAARVALQSLAA